MDYLLDFLWTAVRRVVSVNNAWMLYNNVHTLTIAPSFSYSGNYCIIMHYQTETLFEEPCMHCSIVMFPAHFIQLRLYIGYVQKGAILFDITVSSKSIKCRGGALAWPMHDHTCMLPIYTQYIMYSASESPSMKHNNYGNPLNIH